MTHERHVAKEIRDEYVDTMSKIYYSYFKAYLTRLTKLQVCLQFRYSCIIFKVICGIYCRCYCHSFLL